jgi:hypothetical protein
VLDDPVRDLVDVEEDAAFDPAPLELTLFVTMFLLCTARRLPFCLNRMAPSYHGGIFLVNTSVVQGCAFT